MASVRLVNVSRRFPRGLYALKNVSLEIGDREVVTILGPSGCGKSTLLRIIAGLDRPTAGEVWIREREVGDVPARLRDVAMVFQSYALYPHMTCRENLSLNLKLRKVAHGEIEDRVREVARMLEIEDILDKRPHELSGGQRQRVAVGRALIRKPQVFLFDEPLSNLDALLRERVRHELKELFGRLRATVIYVTHDQVEATTLADRTLVLDRGVVQQAATPETLYRAPRNLFVASFIGSPSMNLFDAVLESGRLRIGAYTLATGLEVSGPVKIGIRPEAVRLGAGFPVQVTMVENLGGRFLITARTEGICLMVLSEVFPDSSSLQASVDTRDIHVFDRNTGENLR